MDKSKPAKKPLLVPDLIPRKNWGKNCRAVLSDQVWNALRIRFGAASDFPKGTYRLFSELGWDIHRVASIRVCCYCGGDSGQMELHELWTFDDASFVQRLAGFQVVCTECHLTIHAGRAEQLGMRDVTLRRMASVNQWSMQRCRRVVNQAFEDWRKRSRCDYKVDLSLLESLVPRRRIYLDRLGATVRLPGSRMEAVEWANRILSSRALFLDTETTGLLDKKNVEVIELAILNSKGKVVFESRFKPRYRVPVRAQKIHGIANEDLVGAPKFSDLAPTISDIISGREVVAYNAKFDRKVLDRTYVMRGLEVPDIHWDCAMWNYKVFLGSTRFQPLPGAEHSAVGDCRAMLRLVRKMAKGI